ncbi:MAG: hypothetical protein ACKVX7_04680 [Planctomycetota bacterium]
MRCSQFVFVGILVSALSSLAGAHADLSAPNGGEVFVVGSPITIEWIVTIEHATENWDLWYSTSGPSGPWVTLALDLPPGDISMSAIHTFEWTPTAAHVTSTMWLRLQQDNVPGDVDYDDVTDGSFEIILAPPAPEFVRGDCNDDGGVNVADVIALLAYLFQSTAPAGCLDACDINDSNSVDIADAITQLSFLFTAGTPPAAPHPSCGVDPTLGGPGCAASHAACP